ncbi:MAG: FtsX-like permease family protein [Gammaproteobacteria bacterium]|nr:FtsX-like permease family protein [Gammaproteobacteria bacterium]
MTTALALRMLRREWRSGELRVIWLSLLIAVAAVVAVGVFSDRVNQALIQQANALQGGDLILSSDNPLPLTYRQQADHAGILWVEGYEFPSMVMVDDRARLVAVKAVSNGYPLRGQLLISQDPFAPAQVASGLPAPGTVWVEPQLLSDLALSVGDSLSLGALSVQISAVIRNEPARAAGNLFSLSPRVLLNSANLAATELVQPASRVRYQLMMAGDMAQINQHKKQLQRQLQPGERLLDITDGRPEVNMAVERAARFLGLAALVSVLLAGVAIAMASRRYSERHYDHCAVLRCLGASHRQILNLFLLQLLIVGTVAGGLGAALGYLAQAGLVNALAPLFSGELPPPSLQPAAVGILVGLVTLFGFSLPRFIALSRVPALRVLRRELQGAGTQPWLVFLISLSALMVLLVIQAGDVRLGLFALLGVAVSLLLLASLAWLMVWGIGRLKGQVGLSWRFGLLNISRRTTASVVQVSGFGLGIMALLLLTMVRGDLLSEWQLQLPENAPNRFLINIQPDQVAAVAQFFRQQQVDNVPLYPMVRGRLVAINNNILSVDDFPDDRAKRLLMREFNLSWSQTMPNGNRLIEGAWWQASDQPQFSIEQGIAEAFGIRLGDRLRYKIAGEEVEATVTSLRSVEWDSFQVNFFVIASPGVLDNYPSNYVSSFYLPENKYPLLNQLLQQFPNITVLDVSSIMEEVRRIVERVIMAVEFVFLFTLLAGLMVMYAAIQSTLDERIRESALLRTLGAQRGQLQKGLLAEFAVLGLLAGSVAVVVSSAAAALLAEQIFNLAYLPSPWLWLGAPIASALAIGLAGVLSTRFILKQPPLVSL